MKYQISEAERERRSQLMQERHAAARANYVPPPRPTVRRFGLADLEDMGVWLVDRLQGSYPHLNDRMIAGWVRGCLESNQFLFLRTDRAVGLAQIVRHSLKPAPLVEEIFVLCKEDGLDEGTAFYPEFKRWAEGLGATELVVGQMSDVPKETIRNELGRLYVHDITYVKLG